MGATLLLNFLVDKIADSGSVAPTLMFVNIQSKDVAPSNDFNRPDLSDLYELIKFLVDQIIAKKRIRIKKNGVLNACIFIKKTHYNKKIQLHFQGRKKIPP